MCGEVKLIDVHMNY